MLVSLGMRVCELILWACKILRHARIRDLHVDAQILLAYVLKEDRVWLRAHDDANVSPSAERAFRACICRRARHEPLAYLVGRKEFYGLDFFVNRHVLIPRPETEALVECALRELHQSIGCAARRAPQRALIDVGTGSGAIAIAVAKELRRQYQRGIRIFATERSAQALRVAQENSRRHRTVRNIIFLKGNLLAPVIPKIRDFAQLQIGKLLIVANLPYIATHELCRLPPEIRNFEPQSALDGGSDGLKHYRALLKQTRTIRAHPSATFIFEIDVPKSRRLAQLVLSIFPHARIVFFPSRERATCIIIRA